MTKAGNSLEQKTKKTPLTIRGVIKSIQNFNQNVRNQIVSFFLSPVEFDYLDDRIDDLGEDNRPSTASVAARVVFAACSARLIKAGLVVGEILTAPFITAFFLGGMIGDKIADFTKDKNPEKDPLINR